MMNPSQLDVIFPRWVYRRQLELAPEFLDLVSYLHQDCRANEFNMISPHSDVLTQPSCVGMRVQIQQCLDELNQHYLRGPHSLRITQSWINWNHRGQRHHRHRHANSIISGTLYIHTGPASSIRFHDSAAPQQNWHLWNSIYTDTQRDVAVEQGTLLLWMSMIEHEVLPDTSTDMRCSLSFNTWIEDLPVGSDSNKTLITPRAAS